MATLSAMTANVRDLCGSPGITEIPDAIIQRHISTFALRWINKRRPAKILTSFETVADQQDYDVIPSVAYLVTDVYWMSGAFEVFAPALWRFAPEAEEFDGRLAGYSVIDNPALVEAALKLLNEFTMNFQGEGWMTENRTIRLAPRPGSTGDTVYYFYTAARWTDITSATLATEYQDALEFWAAHSVLRGPMAIKRGFVRGGREFTGGGGANEKELADKYLLDAEALVPVASFVLSRG